MGVDVLEADGLEVGFVDCILEEIEGVGDE